MEYFNHWGPHGQLHQSERKRLCRLTGQSRLHRSDAVRADDKSRQQVESADQHFDATTVSMLGQMPLLEPRAANGGLKRNVAKRLLKDVVPASPCSVRAITAQEALPHLHT